MTTEQAASGRRALGWFLSIVVALLTGVLALFVAGFVANLCVGWYRISSFEGGSGYFVVFMALGGGLAGSVVGLVVARIVANSARAGFLNALGASAAVVLLIAGAIAGIARLVADVPPTIDGQQLLLEVELRWPATSAADPTTMRGVGALTLGSTTVGRTVRASREGPLWLERATRVDGRWVAPGAVEIFTSRGTAVLDARAGGERLAGFVLPLDGSPGREFLEWSEWLPSSKSGAPPLPDQFSYRFRVRRAGDPIREETVGPFTVGTAANYFYRAHEDEQFAAQSTFRIAFQGKPVAGLDDVLAAAVVRESPAALLVEARGDDGGTSCLLALDDGGRVKTEALDLFAGAMLETPPVTSDELLFRQAKDRSNPRGWLDRDTFRVPGIYLLGNAAIDTRAMALRQVTLDQSLSVHVGVPPLGLAPDEKSFVRFAYADAVTEAPALLVARLDGGMPYSLPIDRGRMRFSEPEELDPEWLAHHFEWVTGPGGESRLEARTVFSPLPYRGRLTVEPGGGHYYKLAPAGLALRRALEEFLVSAMNAEKVEADTPDAYTHKLKVDGQTVQLSASDDSRYVMVSLDYGLTEQAVVDRIAERFDAELATGKHDALFLK